MSGEREGPERERSEEEAQADLEVPKETSEQVRGGAEAATSDKFAQSAEAATSDKFAQSAEAATSDKFPQSAEGVSGGELIIE